MVRNGSSFRPSEYKKNHHHSRIVGGEIRKMRKREKAPLNIFLKNSQVCLSVYLAFSSSSSERASFLFGKEGGPSSSPLFWVEMGCPRSYPRNGAPGLYPTQPLFVHDGCLFRLLRVVIACQAPPPSPSPPPTPLREDFCTMATFSIRPLRGMEEGEGGKVSHFFLSTLSPRCQASSKCGPFRYIVPPEREVLLYPVLVRIHR